MVRQRSESNYLQLGFCLLSPSHCGWWSIAELQRASGYSRASVYRGMNHLAAAGLHIERAGEVLGPSEAWRGVRCRQVLAMRKAC